MKSLKTYFKPRILKSAIFESDGVSLIGEGAPSKNALKVFYPRKKSLGEDLEEINEQIEVFPLGYRRYRDHSHLNSYGKSPHYAQRIALFCLLKNATDVEDPLMLGFFSIGGQWFPKIVLLANLMDSTTSFTLNGVLETQYSFPASFGKLGGASLAAENALFDPYKECQTLMEVFCFSQKQKLNRFYLQTLKKQTLTRQQARALCMFIKTLCISVFSFDFYSFGVPIEDVQETMRTLVSIQDVQLKDWYEQYIHELLVHEMTDVRLYAKYYIEACKEQGVFHA